MKNIREAVHDVIKQRVLPWIERDGISKLILPEQITPGDCARPIKCKRPCKTRHREHEIAIGLIGKAQYCIDNKTFIFTPGRIAFLPAGTLIAFPQTRRWTTRDLDFSQPSLLLWLTIYPFGVRVQVSHIMDEADTEESTRPYMLLGRHFGTLMNWLLEEARSRSPHYADVGRCILVEFMYRCLRADSAASTVDAIAIPTPRRGRARPARRRQPRPIRRKVWEKLTEVAPERLPGRVRAAREFIHSNYHMPISLEDIADSADISNTDHLGRQFKAAIGVTPIAYLLEVRMAAARALLLTDMKAFEVGRLIGIEDACYFGRVFRRINGVTPGQYRRRMTKAVDRPPPLQKSSKT